MSLALMPLPHSTMSNVRFSSESSIKRSCISDKTECLNSDSDDGGIGTKYENTLSMKIGMDCIAHFVTSAALLRRLTGHEFAPIPVTYYLLYCNSFILLWAPPRVQTVELSFRPDCTRAIHVEPLPVRLRISTGSVQTADLRWVTNMPSARNVVMPRPLLAHPT